MNSPIDFYQISLKLILKNPDCKILALNGHSEGSYANYYDLPGGRINENEFNTSYDELLRREVLEELGDIQLKIYPKPVALGRHSIASSIKQNPYGRDIHIFYIFFEAQYEAGDIHISEEHTGFSWLEVNPENANTYFKSGLLDGIQMYLQQKIV